MPVASRWCVLDIAFVGAYRAAETHNEILFMYTALCTRSKRTGIIENTDRNGCRLLILAKKQSNSKHDCPHIYFVLTILSFLGECKKFAA